jgi:hypothetical protein
VTVLAKTPATLTQLLAAASALLPRSAALLAAADWCWETAGGASLFGENPGNLTCGVAPPGTACGSNPLVTSGLSFSAFPSLDAGAYAYVWFLQKHGAYAALLTGDLDTFSSALQRIGYAGSDMQASGYSAGMGAWLPKLQAVVLPPPAAAPGIGGITFGQGVALGAAAIGGLFVGQWASEGFKRPKLGRAGLWPRRVR